MWRQRHRDPNRKAHHQLKGRPFGFGAWISKLSLQPKRSFHWVSKREFQYNNHSNHLYHGEKSHIGTIATPEEKLMGHYGNMIVLFIMYWYVFVIWGFFYPLPMIELGWFESFHWNWGIRKWKSLGSDFANRVFGKDVIENSENITNPSFRPTPPLFAQFPHPHMSTPAGGKRERWHEERRESDPHPLVGINKAKLFWDHWHLSSNSFILSLIINCGKGEKRRKFSGLNNSFIGFALPNGNTAQLPYSDDFAQLQFALDILVPIRPCTCTMLICR
jgi:hypothetical protein